MTAAPTAALEAELAALKAEKEALEKLAADRGRLLDDLRKNLEALMGDAGLRLGAWRAAFDGGAPAPAEDFGRYQAEALKLIGDELRWHTAVLSSLPFPTSVFDLERRWTYINQAAARAMGGEPADFLGRPYAEGWKNYSDSRELDDNDDIRIRSFTRYLKESKRIFAGHDSLLEDDRGDGIGFIETFVDVTKAREAEERIHLMLDATPLACCFFDRRGAIIDCNREAVAMCGFQSKKIYLERFFDLMPPYLPNGTATAWALMNAISQAFENGQSFMSEMALNDAQGATIPGELRLIRVEWRDEYTVLGYFRDLRALKAAQEKLERERLLLKDILDGCPVPFAISVDGLVKFSTPFTQRCLDLHPGDRTDKLSADDLTMPTLRRELKTDKEIGWRPFAARLPDGSTSENLLNAYVADYEGRPAVMSWLVDVTQLRRKERELSRARDLAEAGLRAKSYFLANISHEIRTPMNAIIGFNHLLADTELDAQQFDYLRKADSAAQALLRMIDDILDFSNLESGALELIPQKFHLQNAVKGAVETVSRAAAEKGLEFMVLISPDAPVGLVGDERRLSQILSRLLDNAVKFTEKGAISLAVETEQEKENEVTLRFLVRDAGIGIEPEKLETLFAPFGQSDASFTRRYGGCGLGLTLSKGLVAMMGGRIWCESVPGQGSLFGFTARFGRHSRDLRFISHPRDFTGLSALIVDDNAMSRTILENYLKAFGFETATAASGEEALSFLNKAKAEGRNVDLATMDLKMPGWDGLETTRRMHELSSPGQRPVVIMTTAYYRAEVAAAAAQTGIGAVLEKPLEAETLRRTLNLIFGQVPDRQEANAPPPDGRPPPNEPGGGVNAAAIRRLAGSRILLVEDNEVNQMVAQKILKKAGLDVSVAGNGREALDMVMSGDYDLILMDIQMPVMDGLTAAREILRLKAGASPPIVALTAHSMPEDREKSLSSGMSDHLTKPLDANALFNCLAKWIKGGP